MNVDLTLPARQETARILRGRWERLALAASALLMLAVVAASVLIARRTGHDMADAARSQFLRVTTVDLLDGLLSAETGERGYLLTGQAEYLTPYSEAVKRVGGLLDRLTRMVGPTDEMARLHAAVTDKMAELGRAVALQQAGRHADALAVVLTGRGRQAMETARGIVTHLTAGQRLAVSGDLNRSEAGAFLLAWLDAAVLVLLGLLSAFVGWSLRRGMAALLLSRDALVAANQALQGGRDRLEAAVTERTADLTRANEEVQRFAYIVSHDLRAPLLNIIGFTAELADATARLNRFVTEQLARSGVAVPADVREASEADLPEAIRFIQTSTAKMDRLITAILQLAREGRRVLTPERIDMQQLLAGIADSVAQIAAGAGAEITLGALPPVTSDRLALEQVFSNLVENALKYPAAGRPGRIAVSGRQDGAWLCYAVADNGRGVAARDLERIFELFRRAGPQDTTGEGIGLAHVRALLRRLGGTVVCESVPGVGSTFSVRLPAVLAATGEVTG